MRPAAPKKSTKKVRSCNSFGALSEENDGDGDQDQKDSGNHIIDKGQNEEDNSEDGNHIISKKGKVMKLVSKFESLSRGGVNWIGMPEATNVDAVSGRQGSWERLPIKVDSGAVETVMPKNMAEHIPIQQTQR